MVQQPTVESEFALVWACPDCRQQNRVRVVPSELNMEERQAFLDEGMTLEEIQDIVSLDQSATCARCRLRVLLKHPKRFDLGNHG